MTDKTDFEIVSKRVSHPEVFLEVLNNSPKEQKEAILAYLQTLPEIETTNEKPADTLEK